MRISIVQGKHVSEYRHHGLEALEARATKFIALLSSAAWDTIGGRKKKASENAGPA